MGFGTIFVKRIPTMLMQSYSIRFLVALFDAFCISLLFYIVAPWAVSEFGSITVSFSANVMLASVGSWLFAAVALKVYSSESVSVYEQYNRQTVRAYFLYLFVFGFALFFVFHTLLSRNLMFAVMGITAVALVIARLIHAVVLQYLNSTKQLAYRIAVLGTWPDAEDFADYLDTKGHLYQVRGIILPNGDLPHKHGLFQILGTQDQFLEICLKEQIEEVFVMGMPDPQSGIAELYQKAELNFIKMRFVPNFENKIHHNTSIDFIGNYPILSLRPEPLELPLSQIKKRIFDIGFSLLVILGVFTWLFPILALLIKLSSKGPVFFVQDRSGKNNETFKCIKFRSMKVNQEAHLRQASKDDDRLTKIGRFIRKTNLDELPQFFNVLMGDMSVVGPRPHMLKHTEEYSKLIKQYMLRHWLKPGITGWAQVNGFRGETKELACMQKRVEHDIWYGENWSFYLDLRIIWKTVFNMAKGEKNAF